MFVSVETAVYHMHPFICFPFQGVVVVVIIWYYNYLWNQY